MENLAHTYPNIPSNLIGPKYGAVVLKNKASAHGLVLLVQLSRRVGLPCQHYCAHCEILSRLQGFTLLHFGNGSLHRPQTGACGADRQETSEKSSHFPARGTGQSLLLFVPLKHEKWLFRFNYCVTQYNKFVSAYGRP